MKAIKHKAVALCLGVLAALPLAADAMQTGRLGAVVKRTSLNHSSGAYGWKQLNSSLPQYALGSW